MNLAEKLMPYMVTGYIALAVVAIVYALMV